MRSGESLSQSLRVAFDTSALIAWHKRPPDRQPELEALGEILRLKQTEMTERWQFLYIDGARREFSGPTLKELAREDTEIADLLTYFEPPVMLSRLPTILPFVVSGPVREQAERFFAARAVSKEDAAVLADAVFLGCSVFITMDKKLRNNSHAIKEAARAYGLRIVTPGEFLSMMKE